MVKVGDQVQKNGGNVASHFLTPNGRVIHSVTGPVSASVLLEEAKWAMEMYLQAQSKTPSDRAQFVSWAHQQASWSPVSPQDRKVHELLALNPLANLQSVYQEVFEKILGQKVSDAGPRIAQASTRLEFAKQAHRPILFVFHDTGTWSNPAFSAATRQLMSEFVVIVMPLKEAPALSQLTGRPPFESHGSARPLFVIARSDCQQLDSVAGWNDRHLASALALGWVDALDKNPPSVGALVRAQRVLRKISPPSADRAREITIRVQAEARAKRESAKQEAFKLAAN